MSKVARICISVEGALLSQFEDYLSDNGYPTRSEAMKGLMRQALVEREWQSGTNVVGSISIVYDHHKRGTLEKLNDVQHKFGKVILCSQHVHLDHNNCLEIVVVRGTASKIRKLLVEINSVKGIKHAALTRATTGE